MCAFVRAYFIPLRLRPVRCSLNVAAAAVALSVSSQSTYLFCLSPFLFPRICFTLLLCLLASVAFASLPYVPDRELSALVCPGSEILVFFCFLPFALLRFIIFSFISTLFFSLSFFCVFFLLLLLLLRTFHLLFNQTFSSLFRFFLCFVLFSSSCFLFLCYLAEFKFPPKPVQPGRHGRHVT